MAGGERKWFGMIGAFIGLVGGVIGLVGGVVVIVTSLKGLGVEREALRLQEAQADLERMLQRADERIRIVIGAKGSDITITNKSRVKAVGIELTFQSFGYLPVCDCPFVGTFGGNQVDPYRYIPALEPFDLATVDLDLWNEIHFRPYPPMGLGCEAEGDGQCKPGAPVPGCNDGAKCLWAIRVDVIARHPTTYEKTAVVTEYFRVEPDSSLTDSRLLGGRRDDSFVWHRESDYRLFERFKESPECNLSESFTKFTLYPLRPFYDLGLEAAVSEEPSIEECDLGRVATCRGRRLSAAGEAPSDTSGLEQGKP